MLPPPLQSCYSKVRDVANLIIRFKFMWDIFLPWFLIIWFYIKYRLLSFIIVIFSIVEKVNRVKRQYLTLLYVNICWRLLCWYVLWWIVIIWAAVEYIKRGPLASRITTHHLVRISLYYCWIIEQNRYPVSPAKLSIVCKAKQTWVISAKKLLFLFLMHF